MKVTTEQLLKFAQQIGANVELVEDDAQSEFDSNTLLSAIDENRKAILKPIIEDELRESVSTAIAGKVGGVLERALVKHTGIAAKELQGMSDTEKIDKAFTHYKSSFDTEKAEFAKQLDEVIANKDNERELQLTDLRTQLEVANQKYIDRDTKEYIASILKEAPLPEGADRNVFAGDLLNHIRSKYNVKYDEAKKTVELYSKEKPDMPAMNADKNARIGIIDEAKEYFEPRSLWVKDMRDVNPASKMPANHAQPKEQVKPVSNSAPDKAKAFMEQMNAALSANHV